MKFIKQPLYNNYTEIGLIIDMYSMVSRVLASRVRDVISRSTRGRITLSRNLFINAIEREILKGKS